MGPHAAGVAVLKTHELAGPRGITVNSLCSVSLEPPSLVLTT
jgi:flavin reductase (DIM6/NTAB) family NADH-FMN oxidoreductase RutF